MSRSLIVLVTTLLVSACSGVPSLVTSHGHSISRVSWSSSNRAIDEQSVSSLRAARASRTAS